MLDQALKDLEEKLKTAFNLKMDKADMKHSAKITNLNQEITDLKIENDNLKSKVEKLEKPPPIAATTPLFSNLFSKSKPAEFETKVLNAFSAEAKEKSSKDKNIVIFGLPESTKSNKSVSEIIQFLRHKWSSNRFDLIECELNRRKSD